MFWRTLFLFVCCLVTVLCLPVRPEVKASSSQSRQKRSSFGVWDPYGHRKRSRIDFFDKHDFNFDGYLDTLELALIYFAMGAPWKDAIMFGEQQLRHDIDNNGKLDRWEFLRDNELLPYWPY